MRRVEKAMRDWIFRLRLRKWRQATNRIVGYLSTTGSTTQVVRGRASSYRYPYPYPYPHPYPYPYP